MRVSEMRDAYRSAAHRSVPRRRSGGSLAEVNGFASQANGHSVGTNGVTEPLTNGFSREVCRWNGKQLYWFEEAPPVLQFNPHVRSGYRAGLTYRQCACSIFSYHNETGNIHSHLIPALLLVLAMATGWLPAWVGARAAFYGNLAPILVCMAGSVAYHTFMAHHQNYRTWLALDVCGIFVVFLGGVHVVRWWGLACYPTLRLVFTVAYYGTAAVVVMAAVRATNIWYRALPMLVLFLVRASIIAARWHLAAGSMAATRHYTIMEVLSLIGGTINALRWPERQFPARKGLPGRFDYWFNSHQLMHYLVVIAMINLHWGCTLDYWEWMGGTQCASMMFTY